jgi:hypothetical protein
MKKLFAISILLTAVSSSAFMTVQESNEITPSGKYKIGAEPQYRTSDGTGFNFSGFFDRSFSESLSARATLGTGDTDFSAGGSLKWVPFPDFDRQPAVGGKVGAYLWREGSDSFTTLRFEPLVSKKFETGIGQLVPYASLPIMFNSGNNFNKTSLQVAAGAELYHPEADNMTFGVEFGLSAKDSFSYISAFATIYIDENSK